MLFKDVLDNMKKCLPLIESDFEITKFSLIDIRSPMYYSDLVIELSKQYELNFVKKNISHEKLNKFMVTSYMSSQLNSFLQPYGKKVKNYNVEKFQLLDKKYFGDYLPGIDLRDYPEFAIQAMGVSVQLENL